MKKKKTNSGITLIALIITVIVLLILAGTAISISLNNGDILSKATTARSEYNNAVSEEERILNEQFSLLDYDKITVRANQKGKRVVISWNGLGTKSILQASENEKLDVILAKLKDDDPYSSYNKNDLIAHIEGEIYTLEDRINSEITSLNITGTEGKSESEKLDAILTVWKNRGGISNNRTREVLRNIFEYNTHSYEEIIEEYIKEYGITCIGEESNITVTFGNQNIELYDDYSFIAPEEGTYKIVLTTASGKTGETEITVDFTGLTTLQIGDETLLYDSSSITYWGQLIKSEYNSLRMYAGLFTELVLNDLQYGVTADDEPGVFYVGDIINPATHYKLMLLK